MAGDDYVVELSDFPPQMVTQRAYERGPPLREASNANNLFRIADFVAVSRVRKKDELYLEER